MSSTGESSVREGLALRTEHIATVLLAIGAVMVFIGTQNIRVPLTANVVDPRFFPRVIAVMLAASAILHGIAVARGDVGTPDEGEDVDLSLPPDWKGFLAVGGSFVLHSQLIKPLGWPIAAVVLFAGSALGLGAKRPLKVLAISVAIAVVAFVLFRMILGVYLPAGPFERWVE